MRTLLLISLLFLSLTTFGQKKMSVSVMGGPVHWYSRATLSPVTSPGNPPTAQPLTLEGSARGFTVGVMAHYALGPRWSVSTGAWYQRLASRTNEPRPQPTPGTLTFILPITHTYQVPLFVNYRPLMGRLAPYVSVGGVMDVQRRLQVGNLIGSAAGPPVRVENALRARPAVGLGAIYQATERIAVVVQPLFVYNLRTQKRQPGERSFGYQASLQAQVHYAF